MGTFVFNIGKGMTGYYATLPAANDALIAIPIETTGIEADATLVDYATVSALLAASNNEQTTMGRKTLASVTSTVDNANDRRSCDSADITWSGATGNAIGAILVCYDPDTTGGTDADLIPLTWHAFAATPDGTDIVATVADFYRAS